MDWIVDVLDKYKEIGAAATFLGLFLAASFLLYKTLVKGRGTEIARCERMATVVEQNTKASEQQAEVLEKLTVAIEADRHETERLRAYLEAREQMRRH